MAHDCTLEILTEAIKSFSVKTKLVLGKGNALRKPHQFALLCHRVKEYSRSSAGSLDGRERKHEDIIPSVVFHVREDGVKIGKCADHALFCLGLTTVLLKKPKQTRTTKKQSCHDTLLFSHI